MINQTGKRLAVIGSRTCTDEAFVFRVLDKNKDKIKLIVSGGAAGADSLATAWATKNGVPFLVFPAKWHDENGKYDRGAGFRRNRDIVQYCDMVLAFWDGVSKGTENSLQIAEQLKKPVKIIQFDAATMPPISKEKDASPESSS